ncbi:alpha/beta fold hydrolase [Jatrophihabitans sp.]|jgi:pimeloyl-ACP methyl ester carboxylesterase|uniref:alpha/beta fold hydrolase n=1 Tax=Jatrophihabitans sp. TaxID=1932789 RepID=UPI002EDE1B8A
MLAERSGLPVTTRVALIELARALLEFRPALGMGIAMPVPTGSLLGRIARWLGLPELAPPEQAGPLPLPLAAGWLRLSEQALRAEPAVLEVDPGAAERVVQAVLSDCAAGWLDPGPVTSFDGVRLRSYVHGRPQDPPVVIASACGMPAELCEPWMRALSRTRRVITWETRGLFSGPATASDFDTMAAGLPAQAADLIAVLDHHRVSSAHVMGMCGGAVVALAAAASRPDRISSLSLWHGDYELGSPVPKTAHQQNLKALMLMAESSRSDAAAINSALSSVALAGAEDRASTISYPYLDDELFFRYCVLTGALMSADVASLLGSVSQPALVITSDDDDTAHPAGSHAVAERLAGGHLHVEPHGDHLSVFAASDRLCLVLEDFLDGIDNEVAA